MVLPSSLHHLCALGATALLLHLQVSSFSTQSFVSSSFLIEPHDRDFAIFRFGEFHSNLLAWVACDAPRVRSISSRRPLHFSRFPMATSGRWRERHLFILFCDNLEDF